MGLKTGECHDFGAMRFAACFKIARDLGEVFETLASDGTDARLIWRCRRTGADIFGKYGCDGADFEIVMQQPRGNWPRDAHRRPHKAAAHTIYQRGWLIAR